ncbi:MAG: type II toxin-antitoxin system RelE/ParE family toxin [Caldilinea sp. CFX5]|nr:type II toxin-antitoxin system RelE/ParE family toxin [Caldilinea sp. CFX5]
MRYEIQFTDHALQDYVGLTARWRAMVKQAIETHLRHEPRRESKSRIKRLKGIEWPEYRLRVDELRVFYQVEGTVVQILAVVFKDEAEEWLTTFGRPTI